MYPEHPAVTLLKRKYVAKVGAEIERLVAPSIARQVHESCAVNDEPLVGRDTSLDAMIEEMRKKQSGG